MIDALQYISNIYPNMKRKQYQTINFGIYIYNITFFPIFKVFFYFMSINGSFDGFPASLGYLLGVVFVFSIRINALFISV